MNILIVNTYDVSGGAARAAYRLHKALLDAGVFSKMLVQSRTLDDYTILGPITGRDKVIAGMRPSFDSLALMFYKSRPKLPFSTAWIPSGRIVKRINEIDPDVVHLHWICGGMIKIEDLLEIKAPIVWSLHDNWAFTGGCHLMWNCEKYITKCGFCNHLSSKRNYDLSNVVFRRKQRIFSKIKNMTIIGLSRHMADCAKKSVLLGDKEVINLPNLIDTERFKPIDKKLARQILSLHPDRKIVLFSGINATSDINKGFKELSEALIKLRNSNIELIILGSYAPNIPPDLFCSTNYIGYVHDDISLQLFYSAADVTVVPSKQETLSYTIMESLSCGTPVVAFDVGGNGDLIEHRQNGYLAKPFNTDDLSRGIAWVLTNPNFSQLCQYARKKVIKEYDSRVLVSKYIELYKQLKFCTPPAHRI